MELYLGWLKRYACEPDEAEPLGMILCAGKSEEHIALLELQKSGIHVASYWTDALPKKELERKLHEAVRLARARLETAKDSARLPYSPENLCRAAALLIISKALCASPSSSPLRRRWRPLSPEAVISSPPWWTPRAARVSAVTAARPRPPN